MEETRPWRRTFSVNAQDVNSLPWSEWMTVPGRDGREPWALARASLTRAEPQRRSMAQPTTLRETGPADAAVELRFAGGVLGATSRRCRGSGRGCRRSGAVPYFAGQRLHRRRPHQDTDDYS